MLVRYELLFIFAGGCEANVYCSIGLIAKIEIEIEYFRAWIQNRFSFANIKIAFIAVI